MIPYVNSVLNTPKGMKLGAQVLAHDIIFIIFMPDAQSSLQKSAPAIASDVICRCLTTLKSKILNMVSNYCYRAYTQATKPENTNHRFALKHFPGNLWGKLCLHQTTVSYL